MCLYKHEIKNASSDSWRFLNGLTFKKSRNVFDFSHFPCHELFHRFFFRVLSPEYGLGANWSGSSRQALSIKWIILFYQKLPKIFVKGWVSLRRLYLNESSVGRLSLETHYWYNSVSFLCLMESRGIFNTNHDPKTVKGTLIEKQRKCNQAKSLVSPTTQWTTLVRAINRD